MTETFGRHAVSPVNACGIVIIYVCGGGHGDSENVKVFKYVVKVLELFDAFVGGVYFGFCRAASGDGLAFG